MFSSFLIYNRIYSKSYTRGVGTGSFHFTPGFKWWSRCPVFCFLCSAFSTIVCHRLFLLTMVLCVLSFIVSDYSFDIFKLFLALKSTTETIGSKVPKRVVSVFVCGCLFFIQFWWILSSLYYSLKFLNVICKQLCMAVTVPKIQEVKIGP